MESTYNWYWLVDGLRALGYPVKLANPAQIEQYGGIKHADDKTTPSSWLGYSGSRSCRHRFTRMVVGWELSNSLHSALVIAALDKALATGLLAPGARFHSEQIAKRFRNQADEKTGSNQLTFN